MYKLSIANLKTVCYELSTDLGDKYSGLIEKEHYQYPNEPVFTLLNSIKWPDEEYNYWFVWHMKVDAYLVGSELV